MATFTNQATLSYNGVTTDSNIITGQLLEVLSATKTAVIPDYTAGDAVTYVIGIINSGSVAFTGLTVTDNLGTYNFNGIQLTPLTYTTGSIRYYVNGELQAAPTIVEGPPLAISGINIPAGGNGLIIYEAEANQFAPLDIEGTITNEAVIAGGGLATPLTVTETIATESSPDLTISKALCPQTITENGQLTYTFTIQNSGNTPALATDNVTVSDTFSPILNPISVTFEGTAWSEPTNYDYDETTGVFTTVPGQITVPAATYTQDSITGAWRITPGVATLAVTGTV